MVGTLVYAVGGTGAKLLEALIHLCAAGVITDDLTVRLVDQDQRNGNGVRAIDLLGAYQRARASLRAPGLAAARSPILLPIIEGCSDLLRVVPDVNASMASAFGLANVPQAHADDDELLMQALYTDEERAGLMANGFRGLPAVGAAVYLSPAAQAQSPLWASLKEDVLRARNGYYRQILLLGSAFGGTGAAGLPTIAGYLRDSIRGAEAKPRIGVVLMLRYFHVAGASQFGPAKAEQMKAALEFYGTALSRWQGQEADRLFDTLYLVGLQRETSVPAEQNGGGADQANPALLPELVAALGAAHFINGNGARFDGNSGWHDTEPSNPVWIAAHAQPDQINWFDMPQSASPSSLAGGVEAGCHQLLCSFTRFAFFYCYGLHSADRLSNVPFSHQLPMYYRYLDANKLIKQQYDAPAGELFGFLQRFLRWFGLLQLTSLGGEASTDPTLQVSFGRLAEIVCRDAAETDRCRLQPPPDAVKDLSDGDLQLLASVFASLGLKNRVAGLAEVQTDMATRPIARERGLSAWADVAYAATFVAA